AVCIAVSWQVHGPVSSGRYTLIDRLDSPFTGRAIGSLSSGAPAGIRALGLPANRTSLSVPACSAPLESASETRAAPIIRGLVPYSFVKRRRTRLPPTLTRTTCLIV